MYKLIIVDDEKIIRETISSIIDWKSMNIEIVGVCKDGIEAYDCILDETPDIVMTDIKMPGISGIDLIEKVSVMMPNIEFIILSGYGEFEYAQKAMSKGIKSYLLKPCSEEEIINAALIAVQSCQKKEQRYLDELIDQMFATVDCQKLIPKCEHMLSHIYDLKSYSKILQNILFEASNSTIHPISQIRLQDLLSEIKNAITLEDMNDISSRLLLDVFANKSACKCGDCVDKVVDYVTIHLSDPNLSLKWISENYLYMNADYVSRQFVKQTGEKFSQFLTALRVKEAKKLLGTEGNEGIYEVAQKVGFGNNPQYFSQIFKKYTNMTPASYIKSLEEQYK